MKEKTLQVIYGNEPHEISFFLRKGDRESLVFVHGLGCSRDSFRDVWNIPLFEHRTILTFDLLGFGGSSKPKGFSYSLEDHSEICKVVIEKLNLEEIHLIGHSMGGAVGLLLINKIPSKITSFISLEGNLIGQDCVLSREVVKYSLREFEEAVFKDFISQMREKAKSGSAVDFGHKLFHEWVSKSDPYAFYRSSESLLKWSESGDLLRIFLDLDIRKTYVFGALNCDMPITRFLNDVPKVQISNSGHFMMLDNPGEFYQRLADLIGKKMYEKNG